MHLVVAFVLLLLRLFFSMKKTWDNCIKGVSNVKELVPELYYNPAVLQNLNKVNLGKKQSGDHLGDVELPPWAKGSAYDFVRLLREALESEYVSAHLDEWVDLVFGFKQRGAAAVEAVNVFHPVTYEGNVDWDNIATEVERQSIISQVLQSAGSGRICHV